MTGHAWGLYPKQSTLHRLGWDAQGRLDYAPPPTDGFPDGHGMRYPINGRLVPDVPFVVRCKLDHDAGTLSLDFAKETTHDDALLRASLSSTGTLVLQGVPRGARLRPWVYLSNPGDSQLFPFF